MRRLILCIFFISILNACSKENFNTYHFFALGTIVNITIQEKYIEHLPKIYHYINNLSTQIIRDEENINNASINQNISVSKEMLEIYEKSFFYYNLDNKYDPSTYTVSSLYGFPEGPYSIPIDSDILLAKQNAGFSNLINNKAGFVKKKPILVDFSANAKGYVIDKTVKYMNSLSINNFIINAGGDLFVSGKKKNKYFKTGIIDPNDKSNPLSVVSLENMALATSGNYERYFIEDNKYISHLFSGITFEPVNNYKSVSVISENVEKSDGFATFFYLLDIDNITKYCKKFDIAVLVLTNSHKVVRLCNWEKYEKL